MWDKKFITPGNVGVFLAVCFTLAPRDDVMTQSVGGQSKLNTLIKSEVKRKALLPSFYVYSKIESTELL